MTLWSDIFAHNFSDCENTTEQRSEVGREGDDNMTKISLPKT